MIITEDKKPVTRVGEMEEVTFSIKATSKALKILTSNLYSNPVRAALQELSQNSGDSMKLAGKADVPFTVTLPTQMHPHLVVRDEGQGMSHEFMMKHYTKVFESTKDKDNETNGSMGLGRLSALAVSDAYTVSCFDGRERREYSIFFNERGIPAIVLLVEEADSSPRGVEVRVPVPRNLHDQFRHEAANHVYRFYAVKPIVKGGSHWTGFAADIEYGLRGDGWGFQKVNHIDGEGFAYAMVTMGVYHFRLEADSINKVTDEMRALIDSGIILHVALGDMDVSSNRESIYYNDKTNATLKRLLKRAQDALANHIQEQFDKAENMIAAKHLYWSYFKTDGAAHRIGRILGEKPKVFFKGTQLKDPALSLTEGTRAFGFTKVYARRGSYTARKAEFDAKDDIWLNPQHQVYVADGRYGARVKYAVRNSIDNGYAIVLVFKDAAAKALFYKTNEIEKDFEFTLTSSLPVPPRAENTDRTVTIFSLAKDNVAHFYRGNEKRMWNPEMVEDDDDANDEMPAAFEDIDDEQVVYIVMERFIPHGFQRDFRSLVSLLEKLRELDKTFPKKLYAVRPSSADDAKKAGWISLKDAARPILEAYMKDAEAYEPIKTQELEKYQDSEVAHLIPGVKDILKQAENLIKKNEEVVVVENLGLMLYGNAYPRAKRIKLDIADEAHEAIKNIKVKYPLLHKMMGSYGFERKDYKHYIDLCDACA